MRYQILTVTAPMAVGTDFDAASRDLERLVAEAIRDGFVPQGGVMAVHPLGGGQPTLMQAMVASNAAPASSEPTERSK